MAILSFEHPIFIIICFACIAISIFNFQVLDKPKIALLFLVLASISIFTFSALLDPFLNIWDEQFHALVAKNLSKHPALPTLIDNPIIPYDYKNWVGNYIWFHKQPLFLWQIALSLKIFGITELAVRIPSIIMMSIMPLFIYKIGKISVNKNAGFYGALLFCTANYTHELVSGFSNTDHNDVAFLFYVTASIWAWIEFEHSQKNYWLFLIGLFSGCAILVKWLVGLLVFAGWGISIISDKEKRSSLLPYKQLFLSLIICLIIFVPWQLYIINFFPLESSYEYSFNAKHFVTALEGHGGDGWYYFDNLRKIYGGGQLVPFIILISLIFFYKFIKANAIRVALFINIFIVYIFFSLAATKMISFCFLVSPLIFLSIATLITVFLSFIREKLLKFRVVQHLIIVSLLIMFTWMNFDLYNTACKHTMIKPDENDKRAEKINDVLFIKTLKDKLPSEDYVIFNCKPFRNISIMFYTNFIAYDFPLSYNNYLILKARKTKLAVIDNERLPDYLLNDSAIVKVRAPDLTWLNH
ncbi:MAG: glycosyltransferase family 39 protein [Bacteroidetes bacterium]|nr:glycosyltransferase family 39 protein [Bacteroidota bacterium]